MTRSRVIAAVAGVFILALAVWVILVLNAGETDSANGIQALNERRTSGNCSNLPCA